MKDELPTRVAQVACFRSIFNQANSDTNQLDKRTVLNGLVREISDAAPGRHGARRDRR
ncbi:hypothetical protein [Paraburkholderia sp. BL10I2N1]|uniref:hypothetical protein n=1 Tax=Paraburkholderia sp. BL10I2N1 TaxID=1938796 RepID=UPI0014151C03|nr:hypothetical protein [Paraburkholderia sp. BL10I2N1]